MVEGRPTPRPSNPDAALTYAARGWAVFPLHTPAGDGCSCGNPDCEHAGKHPRTQHGFLDATTDEEAIREWWTRWPDANIGIATGAVSGLVVIDIDPRHGGNETLVDLAHQYGALPNTIESITGGGGRHIFFAHPGGHVKSRNLALGIDIKGDAGYIVAPSSLHVSGNRYEWEGSSYPNDTALAPVPDWLLALLASPISESKPTPSDEAAKIREGKRNARLTSLAGTMRRKGMTEEAIRAGLLAENEQRCDPPLSDDEVRGIARSVSRYPPAATGRPVSPSVQEAHKAVPQPRAEAISFPDKAFLGWPGEFADLYCRYTEGPEELLLHGGPDMSREPGLPQNHARLCHPAPAQTLYGDPGRVWR